MTVLELLNIPVSIVVSFVDKWGFGAVDRCNIIYCLIDC